MNCYDEDYTDFVQCKNCLHFDPVTSFCHLHEDYWCEDDFCSYGKKLVDFDDEM